MTVTKEDVLRWFNETSLEDMGPVLTALADKVYRHRLQHRGFVPPAVFEQLLGPVTVSVQLVHEVVDNHGFRISFALRLRDANEVGEAYQDQYHNTCTSFRWLDDPEVALRRNDADAFQGIRSNDWTYLGVTFHHEAPRRNMDLTFMYRRRITEADIASLNGDWRLFRDDEIYVGNPAIVASNIHQLKWVMNPNRPAFGVLKDSFPPELMG